MADCRDWLATLWPASFKGVPFYVERDSSEGGRRIAIHEFPYRDDPFLEDLGEANGQVSVSAYVANDTADAQAAGLATVFAGLGPGLLVLPTAGPIMVRCVSFRREANRDQHGYLSFDLRFVRVGSTAGVSAGAMVSAPFLGNMVSAAVGTVLAAAQAVFVSQTRVSGQPDYVVSAAVGVVQDAAASFEVVRSSVSVETTVSTSVRDRLADLYVDAPDLVSRDGAGVVVSLFEIARNMGEAMEPAAAASSFAGTIDTFTADPIPVGTAGRVAAATNRSVVAQVARLAAMAAYAEVLTRVTFASRPDGITARADAMERFDAELAQADGAAKADLYVALLDLRGTLVDYLSKSITDLAPVVTVEAPLSMPSLWWAWRLYGDPLRADELVARNRVKHPSFMRTVFEALAR